MLEEREGETVASQTEMEAVYRLHIGAVYRLCYSYLGSAAKAEDAAQAEHEKAWLIVCAQNRYRDVMRSARWGG